MAGPGAVQVCDFFPWRLDQAALARAIRCRPSPHLHPPLRPSPGTAMCSVCLYPGRRRRGLGGRRGWPEERAGEAQPRGFLSWGSSRRGIPASNFLSQLLLGSCPAAPSPPQGQAGQPPLYANHGEIHLCFLLREFFSSSWAQPRQNSSPG